MFILYHKLHLNGDEPRLIFSVYWMLLDFFLMDVILEFILWDGADRTNAMMQFELLRVFCNHALK